MKAKKKMASSKKILIASLLVGVILIGSIITLVAVFAAQTQNISSNVSVSYTVDGVAVKTSATYAAVPKEGSVTKLPMSGDDGAELIFNVPDEETTKNLDSEEIKLSSSKRKVVFEYKFTNIADSAFTISLTDEPMPNNMNVYYRVSATEIAASEYQDATTFTDTTRVMTQAVVEKDRSIYIYVVAELDDDKKSASYDGTIEWTMLYVAPETLVEINLDNDSDGTADGSMKIIPNVAMPLVYDKPTPTSNRVAFAGYYTSAEGNGTQYVNADGTSAHVADLAAGVTLVATWTDIFVIEETNIVGLTEEGKSQTNLVIPNDITEIAEGAFENNTVVETISYEGADSGTEGYADGDTSQLTTIGANAFANCTNLKEISIPSSVTSFGTAPLAGCTALEKLEFPYVLGDGTYSANAFSKLFGTANADIPSTLTTVVINGGTDIGSYAFYNCSSLTSVSIPESVTSIGSSAFGYCSGITEVSITSLEAWCKVTFVDDFANPTYYAKGLTLNGTLLTEIEIPETITEIKAYAFYYCSGLTSITIPSSVTSIGTYAFSNCSGLTEVNITSLEAWCNITFGNGTANPTYYAKGLTLNGALLTEIEIPETITEINNYAYFGCSSLTSINIPSSVTSIGDSAYFGCISLTSIEIPESVTSIGSSAFYECSGLTSVSIPESVTSIGGMAFAYCTGLTNISIPEGVTSIESQAFSGCTALTEINWNAKKLLSELTYSSKIFFNAGTSESGIEVNVGEEVEEIPAYLFYISDFAYRPKITTVTFAENSQLTSIGSNAFDSCSSLTSVTFAENSQLTSIGSNAFDSCSSLTSIIIPEGVTSIGSDAFSGCGSLTSMSIPEGVKSIEQGTFESCSSLISINIPKGVTSIGDSAFSFCMSLISINIPEGVTRIGSLAFQVCRSLISINIPEGVTSIGSSAFSGCSNLVQVRNLSGQTMQGYTAPSYAEIKTDDSPFTTTLDIGNKYAIFIGKDGVKRLLTVTDRTITTANDIPSDVTVINNYAFQYCRSLISINIPEGVTSIEGYAFYYCSSLTSINIPEGVTRIGNFAFQVCSSLTSVSIPSTVNYIGGAAFLNCDNLVQVRNLSGQTMQGYTAPSYAEVKTDDSAFSSTIEVGSKYAIFTNGAHKVLLYATDKTITNANDIPNDVTVINNRAFVNCSSLTSVSIPSSVTSIGGSAFSDCTALTEINWNANKLSTTLAQYNYIFNNAGKNGSGITVNIGEEVEEIPAYLFYVYTGISNYKPKIISVVLPEGSTWIRSTTKGATTGTSTSITSTDLLSTYYNYYFIRTDK